MSVNTKTVYDFKFVSISVFLMYIFGILGPAFFAIKVGPFSIFPFRIIAFYMLCLFLMLLLNTEIKFKINYINKCLLFFLIWLLYAIFSLSWVLSYVDAVRNIVFLLFHISIVYFTVFFIRSFDDLNKLYWLVFVMFCVLVCVGYWEVYTGHHLVSSKMLKDNDERFLFIPIGVFNNQNDYATYLSLSVPFAIALLRYDKRKILKVIGLLVMLLAFYLISVTTSRANILALILEILFLFVFLTDKKNKIIMVCVSAIILVMALSLRPEIINDVLFYVSTLWNSLLSKDALSDGSVMVRINIVANSLGFVIDTFGFGVGAGNIEYWMENFFIYNTEGILNPHNWWLEILANYGVLIFLGYVVVYISILIRLYKQWKKPMRVQQRMINEALLLALIGFSVASISSSSVMTFKFQWMLFALSLAFLNISRPVLRRSLVTSINP